jgi:methionyl aminopeptidase
VTFVAATLSVTDLTRYEKAQTIARDTLVAIADFIRPGATAESLLAVCRRLMDERGATGYWWHGVPALILTGSRLRDSMEGHAFKASDAPIGSDDMVTIDLSPEIDGYWGDAARSFFLRDGVRVTAEQAGPEQAEGMAAETALHSNLLEIASPEMTFRDLHAAADAEVRSLGFENLDFLANYGHSIGRDLHARAFIDSRCTLRLDSVPLFTFEPHISRAGSSLAFKYEEIYRFHAGRLRQL